MNKRISLRERLATMTPDELHEAMRLTAEGDRTYRAEELARISDDRAEVFAIMQERLPALVEALNCNDPDCCGSEDSPRR